MSPAPAGVQRTKRKEQEMVNRLLLTSATIALLGLPMTASNAFAQATQSNNPPAAKADDKADQHAAAQHIRDDQVRASKFIGSNVYDKDNNKVGDINDVILDPDGKVAEVIVGIGGFLGIGEKNVALKMSDLKRGQDNKLMLDKSKDELKQMASFDLTYESQNRAATAAGTPRAPSGTGTGSSTPPTATAPVPPPAPAPAASS